MAEKIVPKKGGAEPSQLELDVANGILNFQVCLFVLNVAWHTCRALLLLLRSCYYCNYWIVKKVMDEWPVEQLIGDDEVW